MRLGDHIPVSTGPPKNFGGDIRHLNLKMVVLNQGLKNSPQKPLPTYPSPLQTQRGVCHDMCLFRFGQLRKRRTHSQSHSCLVQQHDVQERSIRLLMEHYSRSPLKCDLAAKVAHVGRFAGAARAHRHPTRLAWFDRLVHSTCRRLVHQALMPRVQCSACERPWADSMLEPCMSGTPACSMSQKRCLLQLLRSQSYSQMPSSRL